MMAQQSQRGVAARRVCLLCLRSLRRRCVLASHRSHNTRRRRLVAQSSRDLSSASHRSHNARRAVSVSFDRYTSTNTSTKQRSTVRRERYAVKLEDERGTVRREDAPSFQEETPLEERRTVRHRTVSTARRSGRRVDARRALRGIKRGTCQAEGSGVS